MMWYDKIVNIIKNAPDELSIYVNVNIKEKYDEYAKEQIIELFIELLYSIKVKTGEDEYLDIVKDMMCGMEAVEPLGSFNILWYGEISNIAQYSPEKLAIHMYKNIEKYTFNQIVELLYNLINSLDGNCSLESRYKIYNEFIENIMWLYRKREINEYTKIDRIVICGKYSLLSFDSGLTAFAVVSDYDEKTKTWVEEKRFDAVEDSSCGMSQANALMQASNYLWGLVKE